LEFGDCNEEMTNDHNTPCEGVLRNALMTGHGPNKTPSVGLPTGVELRIVGDDGKDAATGTVGEIWVRGATVTAGYLTPTQTLRPSSMDGFAPATSVA
jgi:acyl-CoA synthetase (AMP-forming)/AMP-acid ligase II